MCQISLQSLSYLLLKIDITFHFNFRQQKQACEDNMIIDKNYQ